jgi:acyl carrier protein
MQRVLAAVPPAAPLRGVVHAAGVLSDGALLQQEWRRFAAPFGPKVDGSWILHGLTRQMRLDFFVMYSSLASVVGSSGQANHAAANAFMDALAAHRRAGGLPGLSIAWGAWSEIGAAADRHLAQRIGARGLEVIPPQQGLDWLERAMDADWSQVAVFPVRWNDFQDQAQAAWPMFDDVRRTGSGAAGAAASGPPAAPHTLPLEQFRHESPSRRRELLLAFVGQQVARVISASSTDAIDPSQPLNELGLDSLMAVELRNRLGSGLGLSRSLPATLVFAHPTVEALATYLDEHVFGAAAAPVPAMQPPAAPTDAVGEIGELSDAEIDEMFARKMQRS